MRLVSLIGAALMLVATLSVSVEAAPLAVAPGASTTHNITDVGGRCGPGRHWVPHHWHHHHRIPGHCR